VGNHDGGNSTAPDVGLVRRAVIARNRQRAALPRARLQALAPNYTLSANGLHYSWDWQGVHFAMLGVYPGGAGDCASGRGVEGAGCDAADPPWGWHSPEGSLDFLVSDLAALPSAATTPVVLFTHYGLRGFGAPGTAPWAGYSPDFWWSAAEAAAFARAIAGHNIVALVHGHTHACVFYQWDLTNVTGQVIDVYNAPALQKGGAADPLSTPSEFLVFEVDAGADGGAGRLRAFQRVGDGWGAVSHEKSLRPGQPALGGAPAEPCAVGVTRVRASGTQAVPLSTVV